MRLGSNQRGFRNSLTGAEAVSQPSWPTQPPKALGVRACKVLPLESLYFPAEAVVVALPRSVPCVLPLDLRSSHRRWPGMETEAQVK